MAFLPIVFLSVFVLQATAQPSPQNYSLVYPDAPAPPILTNYHLLQELSSWQTVQIFTTLLNAHSFLIPTNDSLILAPTNTAFIKLLGRLAPRTDNPFSTVASITNTLDKLLNTGNLTRILAYHIIPRDLMETDLTNGFLTASGGVLSFRDFPNILDIDPVSQPKRLYRQIKSKGGSFMFVSDVLLPLPLEAIVPGINNPQMQDEIPNGAFGAQPVKDDDDFPGNDEGGFSGMVNGTFPDMNGNGAFPNGSFPNATFPNGTFPGSFGNGTADDAPFEPENEGPDFFSALMSSLAPALSQDPFVSNGFLIASRMDLQIMGALLRVMPGLQQAVSSSRLHILAPTDTAFINLLMTLGMKAGLPDLSLPDVSDPEFLSNLTEVLKLASAVEKVWRSVAGLPGLAQIVAYHIIPNGGDYESLIAQSGSAPVGTALQNSSLVFQRDSMVDGDPSRDDARPIATFPTLTGYVTIVDSVLTPFDTSVVGAVLDGAMITATPSASPAKSVEESEPACFPADAVVYTKDGMKKIGDLVGGDEIRVDERVKRHSPVFMFTHKEADGEHEFVRITTTTGHAVTLTQGHYVHSRGRLVAAGGIRLGDILHTVEGDAGVVKVEKVVGRGLVAPHTVDGGLIVDGVLVSGYSRALHPSIAHALLAPVRWLVQTTRLVEPFGRLFYSGAPVLLRLVPSGGVEHRYH